MSQRFIDPCYRADHLASDVEQHVFHEHGDHHLVLDEEDALLLQPGFGGRHLVLIHACSHPVTQALVAAWAHRSTVSYRASPLGENPAAPAKMVIATHDVDHSPGPSHRPTTSPEASSSVRRLSGNILTA